MNLREKLRNRRPVTERLVQYRFRKYGLRVVATKTNICIKNSHLVKSKKIMIELLLSLYSCATYRDVTSYRSIDSAYCEWRSHNILYRFGYRRTSTCSTDLSVNESFFRRLCYRVLTLNGLI